VQAYYETLLSSGEIFSSALLKTSSIHYYLSHALSGSDLLPIAVAVHHMESRDCR